MRTGAYQGPSRRDFLRVAASGLALLIGCRIPGTPNLRSNASLVEGYKGQIKFNARPIGGLKINGEYYKAVKLPGDKDVKIKGSEKNLHSNTVLPFYLVPSSDCQVDLSLGYDTATVTPTTEAYALANVRYDAQSKKIAVNASDTPQKTRVIFDRTNLEVQVEDLDGGRFREELTVKEWPDIDIVYFEEDPNQTKYILEPSNEQLQGIKRLRRSLILPPNGKIGMPRVVSRWVDGKQNTAWSVHGYQYVPVEIVFVDKPEPEKPEPQPQQSIETIGSD